MVTVLPTAALSNTRMWNFMVRWWGTWGAGQGLASRVWSRTGLRVPDSPTKSGRIWGRVRPKWKSAGSLVAVSLRGAKGRCRRGGGDRTACIPAPWAVWTWRTESCRSAGTPESLKGSCCVSCRTFVAMPLSREEWVQMSDHKLGNVKVWRRTNPEDKAKKVKRHLNTYCRWKIGITLHLSIPRPPLSSISPSFLFSFLDSLLSLSSIPPSSPSFISFVIVQILGPLLDTKWGSGNANMTEKKYLQIFCQCRKLCVYF